MEHETALIAILAAGLGFAFVFGFLAVRLGLPPLVGYLLAGVAVGPFTPGFVADPHLASQLAEIGVILLMFGVGLHFSPRDLMAVRGIAVPGAVVPDRGGDGPRRARSRTSGAGPGDRGIVFGLCLSVASTVVLAARPRGPRRARLRARARSPSAGSSSRTSSPSSSSSCFRPSRVSRRHAGRGSRPGSGLAAAIGVTLAKVAAFVGLMFVVGRRVVPWLLERVARTGSRELFTLGVLAIGARHRGRRGRALRRLVRARRLLRRRRHQRVGPEPQGRRRRAAAPGRVRRALLRRRRECCSTRRSSSAGPSRCCSSSSSS